MKKKIISAILVVVMLICSAPLGGFNDSAMNPFATKASALTGDQRTDIINVAIGQLGNTNGSKYTFGAGNVSWCAYFIVWCARQANIDNSIIKTTGWADADDLGVKYYSRGSYTPKKGDIIIFDYPPYSTKTPASAYGDHVGLVEYVEGNYVHTIEGNAGSPNAVRRYSYLLSNSSIKGYGVPNYASYQVSHTRDTNYGTNFTAYLKNPNTNHYVFDANHNSTGNYVNDTDPCTIHEVYTDGCCRFTYVLTGGGTRTAYGKISWFSIPDPSNKCTGYNIAWEYPRNNGTIYDSEILKITITPHINNRDAYDSEIKSIKLKVKFPDGSVTTIDMGTSKTTEFYFGVNPRGKYDFYAYVDTKYGSSEGAVGNGSFAVTLKDCGLDAYYFVTDEVLYKRIKFADLDTYLTVKSDDDVVSSKRTTAADDQTQVWKLKKNSDNSYTILSVSNGKALDVSKGRYACGQNILTYTSQNSDNQKWKLCKYGTDQWYIRPLKSDSGVIDVNGGTSANGTNVTLWPFNGSNAQKIEFVAPYRITYYANSGSGAPSVQNKDYNETKYISSITPTRSGYTFLGWSENKDATNATYKPGDKYSKNSDITLYAVWKANTYTIRYNANGGSGSMNNSSHTYDIAKALNANAFTKSGYTFLGWSTSSSATTATYTDKQSVKNLTATNGGTVTLYAVWKANTYTVKYNANGGGGSMSNSSHTYDTAKTLSTNTFTKTGYTFLGWATSSSSTAATYTDKQSVKNLTTINGGTVTLYAVWQRNPEAVNTANIKVLNATASPGGTVSVKVAIEDNPGIAYLKLKIGYDKNAMTLTSVNNLNIIDGLFQPGQRLSDNPYIIVWSNNENSNKNGNIVTLTFKINNNIAFGDYFVTVENAGCNNSEENKVNIQTKSGKITVDSVRFGDVNGDGEIDGRDSTLLMKYLAEWDVSISEKAADVNNDGEIDGRDSTLLMKYLAEWDVALG